MHTEETKNLKTHIRICISNDNRSREVCWVTSGFLVLHLCFQPAEGKKNSLKILTIIGWDNDTDVV